MPHARKRHIVPSLLKRLSFSPVVAIQGVRQSGKSFLVRDLLPAHLPKLVYASLDQRGDRETANFNPEAFLAQRAEGRPFAIDEAQKAPDLFDAIKYRVDKVKIPGSYLLLGSTEFSKLSLIRESLTGRMSRIRLFPMNLAETLELAANTSKACFFLQPAVRVPRDAFYRYLRRGGMPGIFSVREETQRQLLMEDWLELTTQRDALGFARTKIDADLCFQILKNIATLEEPDAAAIASILRRDARRIKTHLQVLTALFVIHPLQPHPSGTGKTRYFLCDVALAALLGAGFERQLHTWALLEQLSQRAYRSDREGALYYYRTPKGRIIHLVEERPQQSVAALKIFAEERVRDRDLEILRAFRTKHQGHAELVGLASAAQLLKEEKIALYSWESLA
jgi:uncharacterized protein